MALALIAGAAITFAVVLVATMLFATIFTHHYQDPQEKELLVTVVNILGITVCLCTLAIVPVDVFLVSATTNYTTGLKYAWATNETVSFIVDSLSTAYYAFYGVVAIFLFLIIPYAYFFFEELDEEEQTTKQRHIGAFKYTSFTVMIVAVLMLTGLFLKNRSTASDDLEWFKKLITDNGGEKAATFVIAFMILVGQLIYVSYTACGLAALPVGLIRGRYKYKQEDVDIAGKLALIDEKRRAITVKYGAISSSSRGGSSASTPRRMTKRDKRLLEDLDRQERILRRRALMAEAQRRGWWNKVLDFLRPFEIGFGVLFLLFTLSIMGSLLIAVSDKLVFSLCGNSCGYVFEYEKLFNPLNHMFTYTSRFFPLDYILLVLLVLYFFFATLVGIIRIGVRFFWVFLFHIKRAGTPPQGLLFTLVLLILAILPLNYTTLTIAPQYATFGAQTYCNNTVKGVRDCSATPDKIVPCTIKAPTDICTPSVFSTLMNRIIYNTPFFGLAYFYAQYIFLVVSLTYLLVASVRRRRPDDEGLEDVDEAAVEAASRNEIPKEYLPAVEWWSQRFKDFLAQDDLIYPLTIPLKQLTVELERIFVDFKNRDGEEYRAKNVWKAFVALDWYLSKNHKDQREDRSFALVRSGRFSALRNLVEQIRAEGDPIPKTGKSVGTTADARSFEKTNSASRREVGAEDQDLRGHQLGIAIAVEPHLGNKMSAAITLSNVPPHTTTSVRTVLKRSRQVESHQITISMSRTVENYEPKRARREQPERLHSIATNGTNMVFSSGADVVFPECAVQ
ncbi:hypothetical protein HK102_006538 [Quaeritorhiza haematococci]|nr:hypothetical protein HK102_006538 [Quaeritorhiza haematococci]